MEVPNNASSLTITASLEDKKAEFVSGYGSRTVDLKLGENIILIQTQAEKGDTKTYTIKVNRNYKGDNTTHDTMKTDKITPTTSSYGSKDTVSYSNASSYLSKTHSSIQSLNGATYEVFMPIDYLHMLNCVCIYYVAKQKDCWDAGSYI